MVTCASRLDGYLTYLMRCATVWEFYEEAHWRSRTAACYFTYFTLLFVFTLIIAYFMRWRSACVFCLLAFNLSHYCQSSMSGFTTITATAAQLLPLFSFVSRLSHIIGPHFHYVYVEPDGQRLTELARYVDQGKIRPVIHARLPLNEVSNISGGKGREKRVRQQRQELGVPTSYEQEQRCVWDENKSKELQDSAATHDSARSIPIRLPRDTTWLKKAIAMERSFWRWLPSRSTRL